LPGTTTIQYIVGITQYDLSKQSLLIGLFFLAASLGHAQMRLGLNKDSLRHLLAHTPADTNQVLLYITLGQQHEANDTDSALYFYKQAGELSKQLHYAVGELKYINNYTAVLNVQGKLDESVHLLLYAVRISEEHNLKSYQIKAYHNLGVVYQYQEDYTNAVKYYLKALGLLEQSSDVESQATLLSNLSGLYRNLNQPDKAIDHGQRAVRISQANHYIYTLGNASINLGNAYKDIKDYRQAQLYYAMGEKISVQMGDLNMQETALLNQAYIYLDVGQPVKALAAFYRVLPLTDSIEDITGKAHVLLGIGEALFRQQQWEEAETHLYRTIAFAREHKQGEVLQRLYQVLSDIYLATHQFDRVRKFRSLQDSVEVSLLNASVLENVESLENKYRLEQKQNELLSKDILLQKSQAQSMQQRYWLIGSVAGILVLVTILFLLYKYTRQKELITRKTIESLEAEKKSVRLQSLLEGQQQERIRISQELHDDMGSGLTSMLFISRSAYNASPGESMQKVSALASSLIEKMNEIVWALRGEAIVLEDFILDLRSLAGEISGNAGIDFTFHAAEPIPSVVMPAEKRHHIYLIVKESIHNVVKHAKASQVLISLQFQSTWRIEIRDNGQGISSTNQSFGNGMKNMQRRANAIQGSLSIVQNEGTCVILELPAGV
jgi:two-component system NarL family sensor kinase